ncbi:hypothetical protein B5S_0050 [Bacillus phage B5S]|uniref:Uncharacterized protein n=1 Tax=Bacillus phage B5S TaxID=1126949 RepID=J9PRE3_9CAUD|nr:hypothetical protein QLX26_gp050 [Bacillus phage B5S]AEW47284.1 hypothetical protein B5S_0050 [Bacillus phage B5S]
MIHLALLVFVVILVLGLVAMQDMVDRPQEYDIIHFAIVLTCFLLSMFFIVGYIDYMCIN